MATVEATVRVDGSVSRRSILSGFAVAMSGLAGCSRGSGSTPTRSSPIVETTFEGTDLVVHLQENHDISRLNLIGPAGELFAQTEVAIGETVGRLEILRISPGSLMKHYTPGVHTLVAVGEDEEATFEFEMQPSLRVVSVEQYRDGNNPADLGRLTLTVENIGTGPSWVYDIAYENAPNWAANHRLAQNRGMQILGELNRSQDSILVPGLESTIISPGYPLMLPDGSIEQCAGSWNFVIVVGQAVGNPIRLSIQSTAGGNLMTTGLTSEIVCSDVEVSLLDGDPHGR